MYVLPKQKRENNRYNFIETENIRDLILIHSERNNRVY